MRPSPHSFLAVLVSMTSTAAIAAAQPPGRGAFVVTLGRDTVAAEQFTRRGATLEGDVLTRAPQVRVTHYVATLDAAGRPTRVEARSRRGDGSPIPGAPTGVVVTFRDDSAFAEVQRGDSTVRSAAAAPAGTLPAIGGSVGAPWAMYEAAIAAMRMARRDSGAVVLWGPGAARPTPLALAVRGADARLDYFGDPMTMRLDGAGRIQSIDGTRTTNKVLVARVPSVDVAALATSFAARPAMGAASPTDSVRATIGAAQVAVVYSRPSVRGRTVWGGVLVPYGQVWRTGANAATAFSTSADLVVGGTRVPAGSYTLFSMPTASGTQLIVSRKTGEWGTEYDATQDLARIPLATSTLAAPVEQFTIAVEPAGADAGVLRMRWADRELSVPLAAAR